MIFLNLILILILTLFLISISILIPILPILYYYLYCLFAKHILYKMTKINHDRICNYRFEVI